MAAIPTSSSMDALEKALTTTTTSTQLTPPKVNGDSFNVFSPNAGEIGIKFAPSNTPIFASGNANSAETAIKKGNDTLSHACDSSSYVGMTIGQIGAFAGKVVRAIRDAIKAVLQFLGVSAPGSGIASYLKKIAGYIKDVTEFIKDITNGLLKFISYMNAIKQLLAYILSLPSVLLQYFKDCIKLLQSQLVSSYKSALNEGAGATDSQINELNAAMKDITNSVNEFTKSVGTLAATAGTAVLSLVSPGQFETGNTQMQNEATSTVFSAAGFSYTPSSGARP